MSREIAKFATQALQTDDSARRRHSSASLYAGNRMMATNRASFPHGNGGDRCG